MKLTAAACYRAVLARDARYDGRFFTCVKTTGIYCRPVCPARPPKRENCVFVPTAAAAQEAGFRPCLRCRPESSPDLDAWRGTSATVSRALKLIEGGALDRGDVTVLAERLKIGERQLRRLFRQHLGASPVTVAQTRRVLLAKQLIHQTNLSMINVAAASGFASVRRFNETFQHLYRRPPSSLRRKQAGSTQHSPETTLLLPYRAPYDWETLIGFLETRAITGVEAVRDGVYSRVVEVDGDVGSISVSHAPGASALRVTVRFPRWSALSTIVTRVRRMFDLSADPGAIGAALSADPLLEPLVKARPGLRVPAGWDAFEVAVRAVLGQQITVKGAITLASRLAARLGTPVSGEAGLGVPGLTHAFPRPERFTAGALIGSGMPGARANALVAIAEAAARDARLFEPRGELEETIEALCELRGVGEWTAHYIAMRAMGETDAFLASDIGVLRGLAADGRRPTPAEALARAERWRPWRAYAVLHLWTDGAATPATAKTKSRTKECVHAVHD